MLYPTSATIINNLINSRKHNNTVVVVVAVAVAVAVAVVEAEGGGEESIPLIWLCLLSF